MGKISGWGVLAGGFVAWVVIVVEHNLVQWGWEAWMVLQVERGLLPEGVLAYVRQPEMNSAAMLATKLLGAVALAWLCAATRSRTGGVGRAFMAGFMAWGIIFFMSLMPTILQWPMLRARMILAGVGDLVGYLLAAGLAGWIYGELSGSTGKTPARKRR